MISENNLSCDKSDVATDCSISIADGSANATDNKQCQDQHSKKRQSLLWFVILLIAIVSLGVAAGVVVKVNQPTVTSQTQQLEASEYVQAADGDESQESTDASSTGESDPSLDDNNNSPESADGDASPPSADGESGDEK